MKTTKELIIADITAKVEAKLASQKVELNVKDDITKTLAGYESATKKLDAKITTFYNNVFLAKKSYEDVRSDANSLFAFQKTLQSEKEKALALGKELGIDVTGAPFYKDLLSALNRFEDISSEFASANKIYQSIKI